MAGGKARLPRAGGADSRGCDRRVYLTRQKKRVGAVVRAVREHAIAAGITQPTASYRRQDRAAERDFAVQALKTADFMRLR